MKSFRGVTLIELLVTISILVILMAIAAPSFTTFIVNNRLGNHSTSLYASLILARSEAIKRNKRVVVCKSSDGATCTGNWNQGWIVFVDTNNDAAVSSGENLVQIVPALTSGFTLTGNTNVASYVSYSPDGTNKSTGGAQQAGTLSLCPPSPAENGMGRNVVISATGKARIEEKTDCP